MKLIVNADDFGYNEKCTLAICDGFRRKILSQTTAMANMPWFEEGIRLSRLNGFFSHVGLHFNLTEGFALTQEMRNCRFFCNQEGAFTGDFHRALKSRLVIPSGCSEILRIEAKAQIEKYLNAGYCFMHLDSHHHVHTDFSVARVLLPLAVEYGFKTCRLSRTISSARLGVAKVAYKAIYNRYVKKYLNPISDEFTDFPDLLKYMRDIKSNKSVEVMVHPGHDWEVSFEEMSNFLIKHENELVI